MTKSKRRITICIRIHFGIRLAEFASVITYDLPRIADRKHTIERVSLKELPNFLKNHFEEGERYIDSFEDPDDPAYRQVILEKNPY